MDVATVRFEGCPSLRTIAFGSTASQRGQSIQVNDCQRFQGFKFSTYASVRGVGVSWCPNFDPETLNTSSLSHGIPDLDIKHCASVKRLPDELKLGNLFLSHLPALVSLGENTSCARLEIEHCPVLRRLADGMDVQGPAEINNCPDLAEWPLASSFDSGIRISGPTRLQSSGMADSLAVRGLLDLNGDYLNAPEPEQEDGGPSP